MRLLRQNDRFRVIASAVILYSLVSNYTHIFLIAWKFLRFACIHTGKPWVWKPERNESGASKRIKKEKWNGPTMNRGRAAVVMLLLLWSESEAKALRRRMRLFRRRPFSSDAAAEQSRLINVRAVGTDHPSLPAAESERDTLNDCNYQTVQAVPAVVLVESPKSSRKKGTFPPSPVASSQA